MIDNPYRGLENVGLNYLHDCKSFKIPVPCGNCHTCIALRQSYFIQRCQMQSFDNHLFMLTLTYNQQYIPRIKVNGRSLYYADFTDVQKMFKRLRNAGYKFSYIVVSEYGGERHRPHFHAIVSFPKGKKDTYHDIHNLEYKLHDLFLKEWRRNFGSKRKPDYKALCTYVCNHRGRNYDLHYIDPAVTSDGEADVGFYVTKYLLKADKWVDSLKSALKLNLKPDEFEKVWKLLKPKCCVSKGFGNPKSDSVKKHIKRGISLSKEGDSKFPYYVSPINGNTFPLSPYYQKKFMTLSDQLHFWHKNGDSGIHDVENMINADMDLVKEKKFNKVRDTVNSRLTTFDFIYDVEKLDYVSPETLEVNNDFPDSVDDCWSDYSDFEI